jgi:uncharacterized protein YaaN involved in tellurite resistance
METTMQTEMAALAPPEALAPVAEDKAADIVPLAPDITAKIDRQIASYMEAILTEDLHSQGFREKMDSAFRLGREEISNAASLMTGRFMERNFVGIENSAAFQSIQDMRGMLDKLNPGNQGDLLAPNMLLGLIPLGNKLRAYFRKFQSAGDQLKIIMGRIDAACDDMRRDAAEIEQVKSRLWDAMQKLKGAVYFSERLDQRISSRVEALRASDPERARVLEQEALFYVRQSFQDMQTQMAVAVNAYMSMDVLKKTAREMINGCNRVKTTGMSALATAQTVARATGNQIEVMGMLTGVSNTIGDLVTETSRQLGQHVEKTSEFATKPLIGIERIQEMFENTFKAMDAMDAFRSQAIEVMGKNNQQMKEQIARADAYLDRTRQKAALEAVWTQDGLAEGPVVL